MVKCPICEASLWESGIAERLFRKSRMYCKSCGWEMTHEELRANGGIEAIRQKNIKRHS